MEAGGRDRRSGDGGAVLAWVGDFMMAAWAGHGKRSGRLRGVRGNPVFGVAGFTLLEVLIALMLLFVVVVASYDLYYYGMVTWWRSSERQDTADHLRVAVDRLARELRTAVQLTENSSETELWFMDAEGQVVRYYHDAAKKQLLRVRSGGTNPVASRVAAVGFAYAPAGLPRTQQRLVTVTLVGDTGVGQYTVSTAVRLRVPR